jgi:hypothetical protein
MSGYGVLVHEDCLPEAINGVRRLPDPQRGHDFQGVLLPQLPEGGETPFHRPRIRFWC